MKTRLGINNEINLYPPVAEFMNYISENISLIVSGEARPTKEKMSVLETRVEQILTVLGHFPELNPTQSIRMASPVENIRWIINLFKKLQKGYTGDIERLKAEYERYLCEVDLGLMSNPDYKRVRRIDK